MRLLLTFGSLVAIAYLAICALLFFSQNRMMFFPSSVIETTPAAFSLRYTDVWIPIADTRDRIHAWWIPAKGPEQGVILHLHGNGINIGANVVQAERFHQLGFSVLLIDYRGYGLSEGNFPTEASVYQDAVAAWNYLIQAQQIPPEKVLIYGHSIGGAIAIDLAVHLPEAAGLIVESSFTSMRDMVDRMGHYRIFPIDWLLTQRFDSITKVKTLQIPVLFIHGMADSLVPAQMSQLLFEAAPHPKQLLLIPEAGHNDTASVGGDRYLRGIQKFVEQVRLHQSHRSKI